MTNEELHAAWPEYIHDNGNFKHRDWYEHHWCPDHSTGGAIRKMGDRRKVQGSPMDEPTIEKLDASTRFKSDEEAWAHIWKLAQQGDELSRAALLWIRHRSPYEYAAIRKHCMGEAG